MAVGALLCNKLLKGKIDTRYVPLSLLGITLFTIDLYFSAAPVSSPFTHVLSNLDQFLHTFSGWHTSLDLLFIAVCGGLYTVPLYAILQTRSEKQHRASIIASNNVINALFIVLAAIITMTMLKFNFSVTQIYLTMAMGNLVVAIYIFKKS